MRAAARRLGKYSSAFAGETASTSTAVLPVGGDVPSTAVRSTVRAGRALVQCSQKILHLLRESEICASLMCDRG